MIRNISPFLLAVIILFSGCNRNAELKRILTDFNKTTITIPDDMEMYFKDYSRTIKTERLKPYIFVIYISPEECIGCAISNIAKYETIESKCKENKISFLPIISPVKEEIELMKYYIDEAECQFPVYIDVMGSFTRQNPEIPQDKRFHVFLIGPDMKPCFVGDPTKNAKLKELFVNTLSSISTHG